MRPGSMNVDRTDVYTRLCTRSVPPRRSVALHWPVNISWALLSNRSSCFAGRRDGDVGPTHVSGNSSVTSLGSDTESRLSSIGLSIQTTGSSEGEVEANKRAFTPVE